ncbi:MAG: CRISPR-associated endoribonuclease Cas6 [Clostridium sp.]|nr:CRISPR-associated endoribonuclease Cas6 [Clostridium sp.]
MKLVAEFNLKQKTLPSEWRKCIISYMKKCLSEANEGKYFDTYYETGKDKPFTLSVKFSSPTYEKDKLIVADTKLKLFVSTPDSKTGFILFSAIVAQKGKEFPLPMENSMTLHTVRQLTEKTVKSNRILIKMQAPLCIRKHYPDTNKDWYYSVKQQDQFCDEAKKVLYEQLKSAGFAENDCVVDIMPVNAKVAIIRHYGIKIECSLGDFILEGSPKVLDYLSKAGMGSRRSSCFGMFSVMAEE